MNNHETILRMIEKVDHKDEKALREIDARVHFWHSLDIDGGALKNICIQKNKVTAEKQTRNIWGVVSYSIDGDVPHYTTSRDAIKSIRPDGLMVFDSGQDLVTGVWYYQFVGIEQDLSKECYSAEILTEELAELHATIQAIAYERQKG